MAGYAHRILHRRSLFAAAASSPLPATPDEFSDSLEAHQGQMRRRAELVPLKAPLPPQRFGFLPTQEFWELAFYTPLGALSAMGYLCLVGAIAYLVGIPISRFAWWHHVLLAIALSEVWSGIFELFCRRALRRWNRPRALRRARDKALSGGG